LISSEAAIHGKQSTANGIYLVLNIEALPQILISDEFEAAVAQLLKGSPAKAELGPYFEPVHDERIPADSVILHMEGIWDTLPSLFFNHLLTLRVVVKEPNEDPRLAHFARAAHLVPRCDKIAFDFLISMSASLFSIVLPCSASQPRTSLATITGVHSGDRSCHPAKGKDDIYELVKNGGTQEGKVEPKEPATGGTRTKQVGRT
jgi:hypothetical protein